MPPRTQLLAAFEQFEKGLQGEKRAPETQGEAYHRGHANGYHEGFERGKEAERENYQGWYNSGYADGVTEKNWQRVACGLALGVVCGAGLVVLFNLWR